MNRTKILGSLLVTLTMTLAIGACTDPETQMTAGQRWQEAQECMPLYADDGTLMKAGTCSSASTSSASSESSSESSSSVSSSAAAESSSDAPAAEVRTVLVDQDFVGTASIKGTGWVKAIGAKRIGGTSAFARLEITLSRNGVTKGFETLGLYVAPLTEAGNVNPAIEWRHVRYIDAVHVHNTRALSPKSELSTLGVENVTKVYDLAALPTTKACDYTVTPAFCPDGTDTHNFLRGFETVDYWIGFLPSRSTAHVTVTLIHDGGLHVVPAVK